MLQPESDIIKYLAEIQNVQMEMMNTLNKLEGNVSIMRTEMSKISKKEEPEKETTHPSPLIQSKKSFPPDDDYDDADSDRDDSFNKLREKETTHPSALIQSKNLLYPFDDDDDDDDDDDSSHDSFKSELSICIFSDNDEEVRF